MKSFVPGIALTPRNPERTVMIGGDCLGFATVLGPPYCTDIERGRRNGNLRDYADFIRLAHYFNIVHLIGSPVEAVEIPVPVRHLEMAAETLRLTDKVPYVFCQSRERIRDVLNLYALARGETLEEFSARPGTYSIINTNTPLQYDTPMATGVIDMARMGQPVVITPFSLAGATTPATLASCAMMANAEILFGATLAQLARKGAPVIYGAHVKNIDLKTGAPAYGMPESLKGNQLTGQLARFYGLPYRSSNFNSSNAVDAAAAYESQATTFAALTGGANLLMHAAGWLEGGLCSSFDKFVIDVEILQGMACYLDPVKVDPDTLGFDEIAEVGPGGHFFGTTRTVATFETAFYAPIVSTTQNYGAWLEAGAADATQRAHRLCKQALAEYEPPAMDPGIRESIDAFVARRKEEGGSPLS
jgi:trimethylamine--corrinoid protein Co-methyltransferase